MRDKKIDWILTLVPLLIIGLLSILLLIFPNESQLLITGLRNLFVDRLGFFYILLGIGILLFGIYLAASRFGTIKLGEGKPHYSNFSWGAMIFTSTMAADILYWSLCEWGYYYQAHPFAIEHMTLAQKQQWASSYPLFHWGPIPWAFYLVPACAYAYMLYVKKRKRQTLSGALESVLKERAAGPIGKLIDIFAIVGLLAGTATTFSLATPLLSEALAYILCIQSSKFLSILLLTLIAVVFMAAVLKGMKAISYLAKVCVFVFCILLTCFLLFGPQIYLIESGISAVGNMINHFAEMATWMDPLRLSGSGSNGFPQQWTIFYWAYWVAWFVATPFFIAKISKGRTIRQMIIGGMGFGIAGTFTSFMVFGGYGLYLQTSNQLDAAGMLASGMPPALVILEIFKTLPMTKIILVVLIVAMVAFYASTFDAITMVVSSYSEKNEAYFDEPRKKLRAFWSIVFLLLPIALLFSQSTLNMLQTISIIAAFPLGIIMIMIVGGFLKELREDHPDSNDNGQ